VTVYKTWADDLPGGINPAQRISLPQISNGVDPVTVYANICELL
jgi:hypothetical protein